MNQQIISIELVAVKPCIKCGAMDRNKSGGCRPCQKERNRKYYEANLERVAEHSCKWREENPERSTELKRKWFEANREKAAEYQRKWRKTNPEKAHSHSVKYYVANREEVLKRKRQYCKANSDVRANINRNWKDNNPEKVKTLKENYRARKKGNGGKLSASIVQKLLTKQNNKCVCCGASLDNGYHLDHIMPLALGGMNDDSNVQLLTPKCNMSKGSKHPDDWAREKGIKLS